MMACQELATAVQFDLPIIVVLADNGMLGTIRMHQERSFPGRVSGTALQNPDFVALARSFGCHAEQVTEDAGFPRHWHVRSMPASRRCSTWSATPRRSRLRQRSTRSEGSLDTASGPTYFDLHHQGREAMGESLTVLVPSSPEDAVRLFGDGAGVTVVGGGTIVVPSLALGRRSAERALLLHRAGLAGVRRDGGRITIGATTTLDALGDVPEPLRTAVAHVADGEIRGQATIGGNICAEVSDAPRGDLQGALIALGAQVRSTGAGGERSEAIEDLPARPSGPARARRLVRRACGRRVRVPRPPAHPRLHRARRVRGAREGRHRPPRRHRHRPARPAARVAPTTPTACRSPTTPSRPPGIAGGRCPCSCAGP